MYSDEKLIYISLSLSLYNIIFCPGEFEVGKVCSSHVSLLFRLHKKISRRVNNLKRPGKEIRGGEGIFFEKRKQQ